MSDPRIVLFERCLGVTFRDHSLLKLTLGLRRGNDNDPPGGSLSMLGDGVLELSARTFVFSFRQGTSRSGLNRWKARAVSNVCLADTATRLGLLTWFDVFGQPQFPVHAYASMLEAVIACIYLDQGFAAADGFLIRAHFPAIPIPEL